MARKAEFKASVGSIVVFNTSWDAQRFEVVTIGENGLDATVRAIPWQNNPVLSADFKMAIERSDTSLFLPAHETDYYIITRRDEDGRWWLSQAGGAWHTDKSEAGRFNTAQAIAVMKLLRDRPPSPDHITGPASLVRV